MIEAEESIIDDIEDVTGRIDSLIRSVTTELLDVNAKQIADTSHDSSESEEDRFAQIEKPFPLMTYAACRSRSDELCGPVFDAKIESTNNQKCCWQEYELVFDFEMIWWLYHERLWHWI